MGAINYNDERFAEVKTDKQQALTQNEQLYSGMIDKAGQFYQNQIDATKEWTDKQQQFQQEQTDFAIEQIEQQKAQAEKDYKKEQSGAYVDYQKQSGKYGAEAEQMAAGGLTNTGFSESSQVGMYNTYQNRVATARQSFGQAVLNYNNAIKDARLQNSSALAEIAFQGLQQQLQYALEGFQYENSLLIEQDNKKLEIENTYYGRYQDVVNQINQENALAEQKRQYDEQMAYQKAQDERNYQLQLQQLAEEQRQFNATLASKSSSSSISKGSSSGSGGTSSITASKGAVDVNTDYYRGALNSDVEKYGAFSNGYQPKGITGYGKVSKSGDTITFDTKTLSGQSKTVTQNIWKTPDGTKWYWDGTKNAYVKIKG